MQPPLLCGPRLAALAVWLHLTLSRPPEATPGGAREPVAVPLQCTTARHKSFNAEPPPCAVRDRSRRVLFELIGSLDPAVRAAVAGVAFDGTSATAMLVDPRVDPLAVSKVVCHML